MRFGRQNPLVHGNNNCLHPCGQPQNLECPLDILAVPVKQTVNRRRDSGTQRHLAVRVRKAKGRKISSYRWLNRQLNDPFVRQARLDGLRSRSAYKLAELDDRYRFLSPGKFVADLGCHPGGWTQIAVERVNADGRHAGKPVGRVLSLDIREMEPVEGAEFMELDLRSEQAGKLVQDRCSGRIDAVLSDMAAPATGHAQTDHLRIMALCESAAEMSFDLLVAGGCLVAKVLAGGAEHGLLGQLKSRFERVHHAKPKSSRASSSEKYVVALGFHG